MQSYVYWSGTEFAPSTGYAWYFDTNDGTQGFGGKVYTLYAVAVRPGDVAARVPEPQTFGLALAALAALWVVRRRRPG
ncbi:MAG: PEP-CTERM sorting domain-containing protein [Casimicrobiaceae bacterium]